MKSLTIYALAALLVSIAIYVVQAADENNRRCRSQQDEQRMDQLKSLEVSEEKANQRVEEFKREMKTLTVKLREAEQRAEEAEKQVKRLQKEIDRLEDELGVNKDK